MPESKFLKHIKKVFVENDIEGLIRIGAPKDEYDSEAKTIYNNLRVLAKMPSYKYVRELIEYVLYKSFATGTDLNGKEWADDFKEWARLRELDIDFITYEICRVIKK